MSENMNLRQYLEHFLDSDDEVPQSFLTMTPEPKVVPGPSSVKRALSFSEPPVSVPSESVDVVAEPPPKKFKSGFQDVFMNFLEQPTLLTIVTQPLGFVSIGTQTTPKKNVATQFNSIVTQQSLKKFPPLAPISKVEVVPMPKEMLVPKVEINSVPDQEMVEFAGKKPRKMPPTKAELKTFRVPPLKLKSPKPRKAKEVGLQAEIAAKKENVRKAKENVFTNEQEPSTSDESAKPSVGRKSKEKVSTNDEEPSTSKEPAKASVNRKSKEKVSNIEPEPSTSEGSTKPSVGRKSKEKVSTTDEEPSTSKEPAKSSVKRKSKDTASNEEGSDKSSGSRKSKEIVSTNDESPVAIKQKKIATKANKPRKSKENATVKVTKAKSLTQNLSKENLSSNDQASPSAAVEAKPKPLSLYQQYMQRTGPSAPGSKPIPKGRPGCLTGFSFLITGELASQTRDECIRLIESLGGQMKTGVSKKLSYLVVGDTGVGPAKLAKAEQLNTPILTEDALLDLIREKSGKRKTV